jgi:hypothetical protein
MRLALCVFDLFNPLHEFFFLLATHKQDHQEDP